MNEKKEDQVLDPKPKIRTWDVLPEIEESPEEENESIKAGGAAGENKAAGAADAKTAANDKSVSPEEEKAAANDKSASPEEEKTAANDKSASPEEAEKTAKSAERTSSIVHYGENTYTDDENEGDKSGIELLFAEFMESSLPVRIGIVAAVVFVCVLLIFGRSHMKNRDFYRDHFFRNTYINGVDVSGLTVAEVEEKLKAEAEDYAVTVRFKGGKTETLTAEDLGYHYQPDGSVQRLMDSQEPGKWASRNRITIEGFAEVEAAAAEEAIRKGMETLPEMQGEEKVQDIKARMEWNEEENKFIVVADEPQPVLDKEMAVKELIRTVEEGGDSLDLEQVGAYKIPKIEVNDAALKKEAAALNDLVAITIIYHLPQGDQVLDGRTLRDWLSETKDGGIKIDAKNWEKQIKEYVKKMADATDSVGKDHTIIMHNGKETVVDGTDVYGWTMDRDAEIEALTKMLKNNGKVQERKPVFTHSEPAYQDDHSGLGDTYIEVNLTDQHLWFYEKGKVVVETDIVSGDMTKAHYTPEGIFYCTQKLEQVTLYGPVMDGRPEWASPVATWMRLTPDGIGLHDATWQVGFGGTRYLDGYGSHGCINMPLDAAREVYKRLKMNETPVVMYYEKEFKLK